MLRGRGGLPTWEDTVLCKTRARMIIRRMLIHTTKLAHLVRVLGFYLSLHGHTRSHTAHARLAHIPPTYHSSLTKDIPTMSLIISDIWFEVEPKSFKLDVPNEVLHSKL